MNSNGYVFWPVTEGPTDTYTEWETDVRKESYQHAAYVLGYPFGDSKQSYKLNSAQARFAK